MGHRLELLDIVQKIYAPLKKLFAPPGDPSWLRACQLLAVMNTIFSCASFLHFSVKFV